jgi:hypothetical protein
MRFDYSYNARKQASQLGIPFARSPEGDWVFCPTQLPLLPIPSYVHVAAEYIEFDGWVFPIPEIKKGALIWITESTLRWRNEDDSEENTNWIRGIFQAMHGAFSKYYDL